MPQTLQKSSENPNIPQTHNNNGKENSSISLYERSRDERIKENLQRMQKLGIFDLSQKLKSSIPSGRGRRRGSQKTTPSDSRQSSPLVLSGPVRRSSRLQNVTPATYSEVEFVKRQHRQRGNRQHRQYQHGDVMLGHGPQPEVYTEEHEKLLGNTERSWTLFVDGCGADGKRVYDQVNGKTCHQCRQKTLGYRTNCCECNMVTGQFCGDCLYMRYGEHVLEALENPNWVCPPCRGICNCSLCRGARGWCPTGALYRKISSLGYKSVAHYLIQTRQAQPSPENSPDEHIQASAKRALSFTDTEALPKETPEIGENDPGTSKPQSEDKKVDDDLDTKKDDPAANQGTSTKRSLPFSEMKAESENNVSTMVNNCEVESSPKPKNKRAAMEPPTPESIAGRLRQRRRVSNGQGDMDVTDNKHGTPKPKSKSAAATEPSQDSIGGRLRRRR